IKLSQPLLPIIMISAVGTFEEGAQAQKFGASAVLSKSRIEDEIDRLYAAVDASRADAERARKDDAVLLSAREALPADAPPTDAPALRENLARLVASPATHPYIRQEAFDLGEKLRESEHQQQARENLARAEQQSGADGAVLGGLNMNTV